MQHPSSQRPLVQRAVLLIAAAAFAGPARAEPDPCQEPIAGCGKAHWACHAIDERTDEVPGLREALTDTDVLHTRLDFEVSNLVPASNTCTINGTAVLTIKSKSATLSEFTFRLRTNYTISSLTVTDGPNPPVAVASSTIGNRTRVVTLNRTYGMDEVFDLNIAYNGNSTSVGFGSIDVGTHGGSSPVVASLSEPYYAYSWWPAKDGDVGLQGDNSDKCTFEMWITVPGTYVVASNGLLQGVDALSGSRKKYRWATNYPMTTYLASFAATNYTTWTKTYNYPAGDTYPAGSMPVEFYVYPSNDTPSNRAAWEKCTDMMAAFRPIYGEYPFIEEKYGIYNFNFGGGMEHQTMTGQTSFGESLTAHELAHQWWGDNVTCRTWSDIWLNEGFATYSECLWEERKAGGINTTAYFNAINGRRPTNNGNDGSVYRYDVSSAGTIFSSTYAYNKGAWVLHMLRRAVGSDATFFDILAAHRAAHQGSAATTIDFAAIASSVSGKNLSPFFNQWVYHRGAPSYQYGWQTSNVLGQDYLLLRIAQTQAATVGTDPAPPPPIPGTPQVLNVYAMPVDLQCTIGGSPQTIVVNNDARTEWFVVPVSGPVTALAFDNNHLDATSPQSYILRGAASVAAYVPGPPKIIATFPAPGESIPQITSPSQLKVTFHTPVNTSGAHFSLVGNSTGPQAMTLVSGSNVNLAFLDLAGPLPPDTYTLAVTTGVTAVNSGQVLDGEIASPTSPASLPSGDGLAGGIAVLQFTVVPCNIAADIDQDCDRDDTDVMLFVDVLLESNLTPLYLARSDLSGNSIADGEDIQYFVDAFGAP